MESYVSSALAGLLLLVVFWLYQRRSQANAIIKSHGCEPAVTHRSKDPFFGFDFQMRMYMEIPFLYSLHQKHGHTYQVYGWASSLPTICTINPDNIQAINVSKDLGVEPMRLPGMEYFCGKGFITTDGATWNHSRRLLKPSFDFNNIKDLTMLEKEVDKLIKILPKDGTAVDLQPLLYVTFLNLALHFVLGVDPSDESTGAAPLTPDEFVKYFHKALVYSMFRVILGRAWTLLPQGGYRRTCAIAHNFLDYCIDQAERDSLAGQVEQKSVRSKSLIQGLFSQTDDRAYTRSQVIQAMMAAQDTTSELLTNTLFLLARYPPYWQQLRAEFLKPGTVLSAENLSQSRLMRNILHETLRLYPIFALLGRVALRDTTLPTGGGPGRNRPIFVPEGSMVVMSYYALHRNTEVFGEDIETFKPERWDHIKPAQWEFLGFGGGNRACLGQQKAVIEASYVLARLSQSITNLKSEDLRPWKGELKMTCKSANGCKVSVS